MSDFDDKLKELEQRNQERVQELWKKISSKIPLFVGILIAIWWVFYGMVDVEFKFSLLFENIVLTIATIVFALTYCNLIADGGFRNAENTATYRDAMKKYGDAQKNGYIYKEEITEHAKEMASNNLKEVRKNNLESNLLKYEDYFNENDELIKKDFKKDKTLSISQKRVIRKCARLHIVLPKLFEGISGTFFGLNEDKSKEKYVANQQLVKGITRTLLSFTSMFVMFHYKGFNLDGVVYAFFQIVLWSASGVMQRMKNYNFVLDALLPQIQAKTMVINGYLDKRRMNNNGGIEDGSIQ